MQRQLYPTRSLRTSRLKRFFWGTFFSLLLIALVSLSVQASQAVVHAVLFYSPSCSHCQAVLNEHLPPLQAEFSTSLEIAGVDVSYAEGQDLYRSAIRAYQIPDDRLGVPTLIIGENVLVGSTEIPTLLPELIKTGLASGGTNWPSIPGLEQTLASPPTGVSLLIATGSSAQPAAETVQEPTQPAWLLRFLNDPLANSIAVVVLVAMTVCLIISILLMLKPLPAGANPDRWALVIPVLALIGMGISAYLSVVETASLEAICGPLGDCNAVQNSPYSRVFNVLPVGIFGLIGYLTIGAAWLLRRFGPGGLKNLSGLAMWGFSLFGVLYSIYLTFLEPFVIGATCMWCISSAVVITLVMLAATGAARTVEDLNEDSEEV